MISFFATLLVVNRRMSRPIAFIREGTVIRFVDGRGMIRDINPTVMDEHYSFPVVAGLNAHQSFLTRWKEISKYKQLLGALSLKGIVFSHSAQYVDVSNPEDLRLIVTQGQEDILLHLGSDKFDRRLETYRAHISEWLAQYPTLTSVDLRYERQVVLETSKSIPAKSLSRNDSDDTQRSVSPPLVDEGICANCSRSCPNCSNGGTSKRRNP
jgi:cell division protein FtsQ